MLIPRGSESFRLLEKHLKAGDAAVMACDTIYGFVGAVPESEAKIREIKGREETKPFLQLIHTPDMLASLGFESPPRDFLVLWPGPFTFILKGTDGGTVAFRVPEDDSLRRLIRSVGKPLYSSSVNRAGFPPMDNPADIEAEFGTEVPVIEDAGLFTGRQPSTLVNLSEQPYRILRQGAGLLPPGLAE